MYRVLLLSIIPALPILVFTAIFLIVATLMEFVHLPFWWIRIFDFPHFQIWWLGIIVLCIAILLPQKFTVFHLIVFSLLAGAISYKSYKIYPYTFFAPRQAAMTESLDQKRSISLLIANVLMTNTDYQGLVDQVRIKKPDVFILLEPDQFWEEKMKPLKEEFFPYEISKPMNNTYGMIIYSSLPLEEQEILYVKMDTVPSMKTYIRLRNDKRVLLYCIHPLPPAPKQDTDKRDAELLTFARWVKENDEPTIVAGDLNDVAWSRTTRLFLEESRMLDPRLGRGYFNSFNAKIPFLRYPLDHIFFTKDFQLVDMERGRAFGSDHFPIYIKMSLEPGNAHRHKLPEAPDSEDKEEIQEIRQEDQRD